MEGLATLLALAVLPATWWALARFMKINGRPWWWRHIVGVTLAPMAAAGVSLILGSLVGVTDENGEPLGLAVAIGGLLIGSPAFITLAISWRAARQKPALAYAPKAVTPPTPTRSVSAPAPELQATSAASGTRQNLRFVYEDARGNLSTRELRAWNATARYIKGYCVERDALRTFRRDRVIEFLQGEELLDTAHAPAVRPSTPKAGPLEILFTGFGEETRRELEADAELEGMKVRKTLTKNLDFLCAGPNAGPRKMAEASERQITVMDEDEFWEFIDTGALPD